MNILNPTSTYRELPLCMYVFYRPENQKPLGCSLLMGSLFRLARQCNWTDLWRYSSDDYDHDHDHDHGDKGVKLIHV